MKGLLLIALIFGLSVSCIAQPWAPKVWRKLNTGYGPRAAAAAAAASPYKDSLRVVYLFNDTTDVSGSYPLKMFNMQGIFPDTTGTIAAGSPNKAARCKSDSTMYFQRSGNELSVMTGDFSISMWIRSYKSQIGGAFVLGESFANCSVAIYDVNNDFRLYCVASNVATAGAPASTWTLYTITYNATTDTLKFYENTTMVGAAYITAVPPRTQLSFGAWGSGVTPFYGCFDDFYFWRGLCVSPAYITWYFNGGAGQVYSDVITYSGS